MLTGLRKALRRQRIRPKAQCPSCGEFYYAPSFFDLTHESTLDGVACGGVGTELLP